MCGAVLRVVFEDCEGMFLCLIRRAGTAMSNLASTYSDLGRHNEALAMRERVLELYRRVLPEDHPSIGEGHVWSSVACCV